MNKNLAGDCHKTNMFEQDSANMVLEHGSEHTALEMNTISVQTTQCNEKNYIASLNQRIVEQDHELTVLKGNQQRLKKLNLDSQNREQVLLQRLAVKERLLQTHASGNLNEASNSTLLDPCVNIIIQSLCKEIQELKSQLKDTQNELMAWQFTPDSVNGKRLMARCMKLHKENEELGKIISTGKLAKLEGELALYKSFTEELKKSQDELDTIVQDLDEDVETMQSTIFSLVEQVQKSKKTIKQLELKNNELQMSHEEIKKIKIENLNLKITINEMEMRKLEDFAESKTVKDFDHQKNYCKIQEDFRKLLDDEKILSFSVESDDDDDGLKYYQSLKK